MKKASGRRGSNPRPTAWKAVALPTELLPLVKNVKNCKEMYAAYRLLLIVQFFTLLMWAQKDSNLRSLKTADLQSAHVGRLWNVPIQFKLKKVINHSSA